MFDPPIFDLWRFTLFLSAATILAVMPGPGIFYVTARALAGGRGVGLASSVGLGIGGLVHVAAGALGVSALLSARPTVLQRTRQASGAILCGLGVTLAFARRPA